MQPAKLVPGGHIDIKRTLEGMEIFINPPRSSVLFVFLSVCFFIWTIGELILIALLISVELLSCIFILLLIGWTIGGYFIIKSILRLEFGNDVIKIDSSHININEKIGDWGRPRIYNNSYVKDFRITENSLSVEAYAEENKNDYMEPVLGFKYEDRTITFVKGLPPEEVEALLNAIWESGCLKQENFAKKVIKSKFHENVHGEDGEETGSESGGSVYSAPKTPDRIRADREAAAQDNAGRRINEE